MTAKQKDKPYHHGNLKEALVAAAIEIISEHGIEGLSLREVSRLAGASHAAPYRHFKDKNDLLAAVAEAGFQEMFAKMKRGVRGKSPVETLYAAATASIQFATRHPFHFRVMYARELTDHTRYPALQAVEEAITDFMHQLIIDCQEAGLLIKRDPEEIAIALWCSFHGAVDLFNNRQLPSSLSVKRLTALVMDIAAQGFLKKPHHQTRYSPLTRPIFHRKLKR